MATTTRTTAIDRFLETVRSGRVSPALYTEDACLDATVPGCGGRWGPEVLAEMGAAAHAG